MNSLLLIECSPRQEHSMSRLGAAQLVERLLCREPGLRVVRRDLAAEPPLLVDRAFTEAMRIPAASQNDEQRRALHQSERLIAELETAVVLVIATPMHNFTVPALLKAWIDQVVRVGRTFQVTPTGKVGVLADRPAYVLVSSGGCITGERARQPDFLTSYMRAILATIGIRSTRFLLLEGVRRDADRSASIQAWMDAHLPLDCGSPPTEYGRPRTPELIAVPNAANARAVAFAPSNSESNNTYERCRKQARRAENITLSKRLFTEINCRDRSGA